MATKAKQSEELDSTRQDTICLCLRMRENTADFYVAGQGPCDAVRDEARLGGGMVLQVEHYATPERSSTVLYADEAQAKAQADEEVQRQKILTKS